MRSAQRQIDYDIDAVPSGMNVPSDEWAGTPQSVRREIARAHYELGNGVAIAKDKACGRRKDDPNGFHGLHAAEHKLARLRATGRSDADLEASIARLREKLSEDDRRLTANDDLYAMFAQLPAAKSMSLDAYLDRCVEIEKDLMLGFAHWKGSGDPGQVLQAFVKAADAAGHDGVQTVHAVLQNALNEEGAEA